MNAICSFVYTFKYTIVELYDRKYKPLLDFFY